MTANTALAYRRAVKTDAARITDLDVDESNRFILVSEGQRSRSRVKKHYRRGSLHSCECWRFSSLCWFDQLSP